MYVRMYVQTNFMMEVMPSASALAQEVGWEGLSSVAAAALKNKL